MGNFRSIDLKLQTIQVFYKEIRKKFENYPTVLHKFKFRTFFKVSFYACIRENFVKTQCDYIFYLLFPCPHELARPNLNVENMGKISSQFKLRFFSFKHIKFFVKTQCDYEPSASERRKYEKNKQIT